MITLMRSFDSDAPTPPRGARRSHQWSGPWRRARADRVHVTEATLPLLDDHLRERVVAVPGHRSRRRQRRVLLGRRGALDPHGPERRARRRAGRRRQQIEKLVEWNIALTEHYGLPSCGPAAPSWWEQDLGPGALAGPGPVPDPVHGRPGVRRLLPAHRQRRARELSASYLVTRVDDRKAGAARPP